LRDAKNEAASKEVTEKKHGIEAAKQEYRRCEAHAHLIWQYYPASPPADAAPDSTTTTGSSGSATPKGTTTRP